MASKVLTNAYVSLSSNNLSAYANQVEITYEAETLDDTAFGDDTRIFMGGLKNWEISVTFHNDYTDNLLDEILFGLIGTTGAIDIRPENTTIGTGNPSYSGTGLYVNYSPVSGNVGELAATQLTIKSASTLTRDVTP